MMDSDDSATAPLDFDALARKYAEERDKRLGGGGLAQYRHLEGQLAVFADDPNALPDLRREPIEREVEVVVIGGGFGGLLTAAHLRQRGVREIVTIEKGADFGGTWYWNRYPGIRCDVDSYVYLPMLEETGYMPTEKYAKGAEIFLQCRLLAQKFDLYRDALFQTVARTLTWDEARKRWRVATDRGDRIEARFVVSATGLFGSPKLPGIPGIEQFEGPSFHTSRWDYSVTGGNADGSLIGLEGKRVGIIGTGSTGIQCVPAVARHAKQLYLFQRTPCSVDVRGNRPTDAEWFASRPPGWQRERVRNFTQWTAGAPEGEDLVADSMTALFRPLADASAELSAKERERAEMLKMEAVRRRIGAVVRDPITAEALKPYYDYFCKRPGFSDDYLQTFNRDNVTLVDTAGKGVEGVTATGLVVAGREYPLDVIIYATGFDFMTSYVRESGITVSGRNGLTLEQHWARGARTLFGLQTRGFPNLFVISVVQAGISINYLHTAEVQSDYVAQLIGHCLEHRLPTVEPTAEAEAAWVKRCLESSEARREFHAKCTPGYLNFEGARPPEYEYNVPFGGGPLAYFAELEEMVRSGFSERLEFPEADRA